MGFKKTLKLLLPLPALNGDSVKEPRIANQQFPRPKKALEWNSETKISKKSLKKLRRKKNSLISAIGQKKKEMGINSLVLVLKMIEKKRKINRYLTRHPENGDL